jgi:metallophosphoesterase (TIGR00282 family)
VTALLPNLKRELDVTMCVVNCENAAGGAGVTHAIVETLLTSGADILTSGNHIWAIRDVFRFIDDEPRLLRPLNYSGAPPGHGATVLDHASGHRLLVMNALGRVFMDPVDCPFHAVDDVVDAHPDVPLRLLDFHAEATSEKVAMGWHLDGRVTAVVGTHTHVPTADERVLPQGTACITDVGMTGPYTSVIGVEPAGAIRRMTTGLPTRFETASGDARLAGVLIDADAETGRAHSIARIMRTVDD